LRRAVGHRISFAPISSTVQLAALCHGHMISWAPIGNAGGGVQKWEPHEPAGFGLAEPSTVNVFVTYAPPENGRLPSFFWARAVALAVDILSAGKKGCYLGLL
jgi:hypothetical protein